MTEKTKSRVEIIKRLRSLPDSDEDEEGYPGIYTYRGRVFVIANGSDSPFWVYESEFQDKVVDLLKNGKFETDNSFQ